MKARLDVRTVRDRFPSRLIIHFETIASTMVEASRLAAENCESGTVVVAEEQTAGQGRHGHTWHSEPGAGLYLSIVLRMPVDPVLTLALGLAAREAILRATALEPDLRWPNDVMLENKKVAGILVQLSDSTAIAGIGLNVNHLAFPAEIATEATSLRLQTGQAQSRENLLTYLLLEVDQITETLARQGKFPILREFEKVSTYANGRSVQVQTAGGLVTGITAGLDESGFLKIRKPDGGIELILAGGVRPA